MKFEFISKTSIFFSKMLNGTDEVSSKRFIMIGSFFCLVIMMVVSFWNIHIDEKILFCFASLAGSASALTVIEKVFNKNNPN